MPEYSLLSGFIQHILKIKWNVYAGRANNEEGCMTVLHERLTRDMSFGSLNFTCHSARRVYQSIMYDKRGDILILA